MLPEREREHGVTRRKLDQEISRQNQNRLNEIRHVWLSPIPPSTMDIFSEVCLEHKLPEQHIA